MHSESFLLQSLLIGASLSPLIAAGSPKPSDSPPALLYCVSASVRHSWPGDAPSQQNAACLNLRRCGGAVAPCFCLLFGDVTHSSSWLCSNLHLTLRIYLCFIQKILQNTQTVNVARARSSRHSEGKLKKLQRYKENLLLINEFLLIWTKSLCVYWSLFWVNAQRSFEVISDL